MGHIASQGNPVVRELVLPLNTEVPFTPTGGGRSVQIHSRNGFDVRIATEVGGTAGGSKSYLTLSAGTYFSLPSDIQGDNFYFRSMNATTKLLRSS